MTDTYEPDDDQADDDPTPRDLRKLVADRTREADDLKAQIGALQREAAFAKAGIDSDDKRMAYFAKAYDGPSDVEAIRTAATEAGFLTPTNPEPSPIPEPPSRIAAASSGAGTPAPTNLADAILAATSPEEVIAIVESEQAAAAGLRSVRQNQ